MHNLLARPRPKHGLDPQTLVDKRLLTQMKPAKPLSSQDLELILEQTTPLWEETRGRRIFVTGGTGFFGCWLLESFCHINQQLQLNAAITVLTRDPVAFQQKCPHLASRPEICLHQGDVRTFEYPAGQFHYVVHAAADTNALRAAQQPLELFSTIVHGTERVLRFASECGAQKLLLTSSGAVYGRQPPELSHVPEDWNGAPTTGDPSNAYAEGKRAAELLCTLHAGKGGLECKIARCWAFCGPHLPLDQHFAIGNFIADVLAHRPIQVRGDGMARRSYLYAAEMALWLWTILFRAPALVPINVGSAHDVSILELAQTVAATVAPGAEVHVAQPATPGSAPALYVPAVERASQMLGLRQRIGLAELVRRTADWYRG